MNESGPQQNLVCYNCNKMGHIAKCYRKKKKKTNDPKRKIDINEEKGKMKMTWEKRSKDKFGEKIEDGPAPIVGDEPSSRN